MFVRQLIGRAADQIVEMPYAAAQSNIEMGTCVVATDEEIAQAGLAKPEPIEEIAPEEMPAGFKAIPTAGGGYDVINSEGDVINSMHIPNQPAARSFAAAYADEKGIKLPEPEPEPEPEIETPAQPTPTLAPKK